jgi:hypothetical protein
MPELGLLEAYTDINNLLKRGIAYHHAGMLPILREYVELCFQARLVKVRAGSTFSSGSRQVTRVKSSPSKGKAVRRDLSWCLGYSSWAVQICWGLGRPLSYVRWSSRRRRSRWA